MTRIYVVRHAEAEGNLYRILQGQYDSNLTERGYQQLSALKKRFLDVHLDAVYTSDLIRATATAMALSEPKGLEVRPMKELREICVGVWEGRTWADLNRENPEMNYNFNKAPQLWKAEGSETFFDLRDRMMAALRQIIRENPDRTVAISSHGAAIRTMLGTIEGMELSELGQKTGHADNTAVTLLEAEGDEIRVVYRDDASHLPRELSTFARQKWHQADQATEPGLGYEVEQDDRGIRAVGILYDEKVAWLEAELKEDHLLITRYELLPSLRGRNYGIQPLGQAVYFARAHGKEHIRIALPEESVGFFEKNGFMRREDGTYELDIRRRIRPIP